MGAANLVMGIVPKTLRLSRLAAKKLLAIFLHLHDHSAYTCVARYCVSKALTMEEMRHLLSKLRRVIAEADSTFLLLGWESDGAYPPPPTRRECAHRPGASQLVCQGPSRDIAL